MAVNKEQDLYAPIIAGTIAERWTIFRIEDGAYGKKPFDIAGIAPDGRGVGIEVKLVESVSSNHIPWSKCSEHQINWLREYSKYGAYALLAVYDRNEDKLKVFSIHKDNREFDYYEMVLDKFKRWCGWSQLLNDD